MSWLTRYRDHDASSIGGTDREMSLGFDGYLPRGSIDPDMRDPTLEAIIQAGNFVEQAAIPPRDLWKTLVDTNANGVGCVSIITFWVRSQS